METRFTPGPWQFKKVSVWAPTVPTDGIPVFEFCFAGGEEWMRKARANARLISASPELLEACKRALAGLYSYPDIPGNGSAMTERDLLRDAISKAEAP